jgi:EAL domain-containing protein (putative c-di-GMP-specific phosphodiesterase class I)/CheY-like chemotaxis protein
LKPIVLHDVAELRFLVVEDQGFQRWAVGHALETLGAKHVFSAEDGRAALEIYKNAAPAIDVIITDLNMPGMDGIEFIRHVSDYGAPVALILASDQAPALVASVEKMALAYGVNLLEGMQKPVTAKKLSAALARYTRPDPVQTQSPKKREFSLGEINEGLGRGEFVPYFQAKVDLANGLVRGAEAVARWNHPLHGLVTPEFFVSVLEASWEIDDLTTTMLRSAAACCRGWRAEGTVASVSVNVSLTSLTDVTLADRLTEIVGQEGIEPRDVVLEVTETAAASHLGKVLGNLSRLRMKGFGLAIDDYGTGYSSMQQLTRIPFTELKIDQSFVRNAPSSSSSRAMLESSLEMARKLGIVAVAEGVETQEEVVLLRELGCDMAQGYLVSRPLACGEFSGWLQNGGRRL